MRSRGIRFVVCALALLLLPSFASAQRGQGTPNAQPPQRSIREIAPGVFYYQNDQHFGIFAVTPEGVIVVDPIRVPVGEWLKGEIAARSKQPVRWVIYSHHDCDHSEGAQAFQDTVKEIIAHVNMPASAKRDMCNTVMPTRTFDNRLDITLGGKRLELIESGPGHTDNLVHVRFPQERILFVVDMYQGKRLPFNGIGPDYDVDVRVNTLKQIAALDFAILAPGHVGLSSRAELEGAIRFHEVLRAEVAKYRKEGRTVDEMKKLITMDEFKDWGGYSNWLPPSIEGMNNYLAKKGL